MICTNPNCKYSWTPRKKAPKSCPACKQYIKRNTNKGENNGQWKGDEVSYGALHDYVKYHLTRPMLCESCRESKPLDLANKSGEYKRDLSDWSWLCRKCHMDSDGRLDKLHEGKIGSKHTDAARRKMSESQRQVVHTKEWAQKISEGMKRYRAKQYLKSSPTKEKKSRV